MTARIIIYRTPAKPGLFAKVVREEVLGAAYPVPPEDIVFEAATQSEGKPVLEVKTLRYLVVMGLKRPTPTRITWEDTEEVWKF